MTATSPRSGKLLLWLGVALLAVFALLTGIVHRHIDRTRFLPSEELMAELAEVEFLDDPPPAADVWPGWLGVRRDGVGALEPLPRSWHAGEPRRHWRVAGGDGYSSFAVAGGRVHGMIGRDDSEVIVCLALDTGRELWTQAHQPQSRSEGYEGPRATPTLRGDRLWTVTSDGVLWCLATGDGAVRWRCNLPQTFDARPPRWGYAFSPLVVGNRVYVVPGGRRGGVAALDAGTGAIVWTSQDDSAGYSSPIHAVLDGVEQVVFFTGRRLIGVAASDGTLLWQLPWPTSFEVNAATPLLIRATRQGKELTYLFISSGYNQGCALVKVESAGAGRFLARPVYTSNELCCHFATPIRHRGHVYGLDETRDLTCLDLRTGQVAWRFDKPDDDEDGLRRVSFKKGSLLRAGDTLIVLGEEGKLALVEATPQEYRERAAARPFRDRCWTMPVLADGRLIVRDRRSIACYDLRGR